MQTAAQQTDNDIIWQLTDGYWGSGGRRKFDLGPDRVITVNLSGLTEEGKSLAREALDTWSLVAGITFRETAGPDANIMFQDHEPGAFARVPASNGVIIQSVVNVSTGWLVEYGTDLNSYTFTTYIHEIGHALGLGHPGDYNGDLGLHNVGRQFELDARLFTVMSYASEETDNPITAEFALDVFPATPMLFDIAAIWVLYGEPPGGINPGDTIYTSRDVPDVGFYQQLGWLPTSAVTLVDTGGEDTLYLGDTSDVFGLTEVEGEVYGLGSVNDAPIDFINEVAAWNLLVLGEIENLYGGGGDDILIGGPADNRLAGEAGDDVLVGGAGADTFVFQPSDNPTYYTDTILDFNPAQGDRIDLSAYRNITGVPENWIVQDPDFSRSRVLDLDGDSYYDIDLDGYTGRLDEAHFIFAGGNTSTTTVTGTAGDDDPLTGTDGNDRLAGLAGDDQLLGWHGDDHLDGGDGDDILDGGPGADTLVGGPGVDTASYLFSPAAVTINLHDGTARGGDAWGDTLGDDIENVWGSAYDDVITGTNSLAVGNIIFGLAGNDELYGGWGDDILIGGEGNDLLSGGDEDDYLVGGPGANVLVGGLGDDTAAYWDSPAGVTVRLHSLKASGGDAEGDTWGDLVTVRYTSGSLVFQETVPDIINLAGSDHDDVLAGDSRDNVLFGGDGNDKLFGGPGGGDDILNGQKGDDALYGGLGDDFLVGGPGADRLVGGQGADGFLFEPGDTLDFNDIIADFNPAQGDRIVLSGYGVASFQDKYWVPDGSADTYVDLDGNGWSDIVLTDYTEPLPDHYFIFV